MSESSSAEDMPTQQVMRLHHPDLEAEMGYINPERRPGDDQSRYISVAACSWWLIHVTQRSVQDKRLDRSTIRNRRDDNAVDSNADRR